MKSMYTSLTFLGLIASISESQTNPSSWRPIVYDQVHWIVPGSFQNTLGQINQASKTIILPNGSGQNNLVFYSVRVQGARINGVTYNRSGMTGADFTDVQSSYYRYWGDYVLGPWTLRSEFIFHKSGEFEFKNSFVGSQPTASQTEVYLRIDHDVVATTNNIVETAGANGWSAQGNSFAQPFPAMARASTDVVHNNAYFRIFNAVSPQNQFSVVFWPSSSSQGDNSPVTLTVKRNSDDNMSLPPTTGAGSIQDVHSDPSYGSYGWRSTIDQVMYLTLTKAQNRNYYGISGKVFQKPSGRSLQVHLHAETGAPVPSATNQVMTTGRSMNNAFNDLTDSKWSYHITTNRAKNITPTTCGGFTNSCLTSAQLHNLMTFWRGESGAYTSANRSNYQDWRVDVLSILARWSNTPVGIGGVIFDTPGSDQNNVPREGVALFWPALTATDGTGYGSNATSVLPFILLHEVGHAFNAKHAWAESPPTIMNSAGFGAGQTMQWETVSKNWFRNGPESWVKPGRYGASWNDFKETQPTYLHYGTGTSAP